MRFGVTAALKDPDAAATSSSARWSAWASASAGSSARSTTRTSRSSIRDTRAARSSASALNLRFDVDRAFLRCTRYACTRATSFYIEAGAAERFGHWFVDHAHVSPVASPTRSPLRPRPRVGQPDHAAPQRLAVRPPPRDHAEGRLAGRAAQRRNDDAEHQRHERVGLLRVDVPARRLILRHRAWIARHDTTRCPMIAAGAVQSAKASRGCPRSG